MNWECPDCGATYNKHGKGGSDKCKSRMIGSCGGFICECDDDDDKDHGTDAEPCENASCYHCGWYGTFPVLTFNVKKLKGWAKTAYACGWRPPKGWTPSEKEKA